jgi:hypothetical protein
VRCGSAFVSLSFHPNIVEAPSGGEFPEPGARTARKNLIACAAVFLSQSQHEAHVKMNAENWGETGL